MSTLKSVLIDRYFKESAEVEISGNDEGFIGSWYLGTILRVKKSSLTAVVEYKTLVDEKDERLPLREKMDLVHLRPPQPDEERHKFAIDDDVDAYYHDGWWEGIITGLVGEDKYAVFFRHSREQRAFKASKLRLHREWVYGKWHPALEEQRQDSNDAYGNEVPVKSPKVEVPASKKRKIQPRDDLYTQSKDVPSPAEMQDVPSPAEMREVPISTEYTPNKEHTKHGFRPAQIVEVSNEEDGFEGAWFSATLLQILNADKYLVEYQTLTSDDGKTLLIEEVDSLHIRPCPPEVLIVDRFNTLEEVDAFYNDGWWVGKISKVLKDDKYTVYFSSTNEEEKLKHSKLRVHQEWINGRWVIPNKVPVKSPEVEVPAFKKRKIQSRDHLYTPSKDVPLTAEMQGVPLSAETPISTENTPNKEQAKHGFIPGQLVEVSSDDEGFEGAWFPATVVQTLNANKYLIEYQSILSNDNKSLLTEKVDSQHMRPCPPEVSIVDRFDILEDVDVFYNDCWWAGAISKVLKDDRYNVYFGTTDEEMKFKHSQLRVHQKWINGRWVIPSKALEL